MSQTTTSTRATECHSAEEIGKNAHTGFELTYRAHASFVSHLVRRFGVSPNEVEDAVQEVFIVLHRRFQDLQQPALIRRWLAAVARHVCRNRARSADSAKTHLTKPNTSQTLGGRRLTTRWRTARRCIGSSKLLSRLAPPKRDVLVMAEFEGLSIKEIARISEIPLNTVASRLRSARHEICLRLGVASLS